ncbi:MAG: flagellar biosynthetic protein FliO [Clostridia bacterium]|nr:flagellar biosynthetic protein FliO [Clostridia bacterium]MCL6520966.1 flagellar biosynthetic protein FliO [Bacillota bacterium]
MAALGEVLRVLAGLLAFLAVVALAYFASLGVGRLGAGAGGPLRIVGQLPLGPRRGLALVRMGDELLLLGVTDRQVTLLERVDEPERVARLDPPGGGGGQRFAELLGRRLAGKREEP